LENGFSIELCHKKYVKSVTLSNHSHDRALFDGVLGSISSVNILEDSVIEFIGKNGVIRIDIDPLLIEKALCKRSENPNSNLEHRMR
jgi:hypothetical protein